jgi:Fic family protein
MLRIYHQYSIKDVIKGPKAPIFYKWLRRELVYTSNALELNTLTRKETGDVLDPDSEKLKSKRKYRDSIESINLANTLDASMRDVKNGVKIDERFIMSMHAGIMRNIDDYNAGFYRNCNVRPMGYSLGYPNYLKVPRMMEELTNFIAHSGMHVFDMAVEAHYRLAKIHPFADGNGRTARLLMNVILMNGGIIPIFVTPETRKEYMDALYNYRADGDGAPYREFMYRSFYASALTVCEFIYNNRAH